MPHTKESKKKAYNEPVVTDFGKGAHATEKVIDWAISKGITREALRQLLSELETRKSKRRTQT